MKITRSQLKRLINEAISKSSRPLRSQSISESFLDRIMKKKFDKQKQSNARIDSMLSQKEKDKYMLVHTAASHKSVEWYNEAFDNFGRGEWIFGIDGLPNESHKYRVNQDGEKLFKIMCESKKYLNTRSVWQYIIFNYNEDHLEEAKKMADEHDLFFIQKQSSRWLSHDDPYMPSKKYKLGSRHG